MSEPTVIHTSRPIVDILADADKIAKQYPPMVQDRPHVQIEVEGDTLRISGHTRTSVTHRYITYRLGTIDGINAVEASGLYSDDRLRLAVGEKLPAGVFVQMLYGTAILSGSAPADISTDSLIAEVKTIPGIRDVAVQWQR